MSGFDSCRWSYRGQQTFPSWGKVSCGATATALTVVFAAFGAARAENECGRPEDGVITCSPSNYAADTEGSIIYCLTQDDQSPQADPFP
ncbi:hypothetical protein FLM9_753 [Candidatus Synechococcus spongiarum]|uniref:Uncharacterized protein n=1 Tax=Candidatus Synechococcus spongiarum TaxID=431041 RepID=A0A165AH92_9SYNE|nr:hypothetical protein FLM9_753 [Candidatus Synechococcus spongiarum]